MLPPGNRSRAFVAVFATGHFWRQFQQNAAMHAPRSHYHAPPLGNMWNRKYVCVHRTMRAYFNGNVSNDWGNIKNDSPTAFPSDNKERAPLPKMEKSHLRTPKKRDDTNLTHTCDERVDRRELCKGKTCYSLVFVRSCFVHFRHGQQPPTIQASLRRPSPA